MNIIRKFFNGESIIEFSKKVILNYLPMTPELLGSWQEDPEDFLAEEMSDLSTTRLGPAAELFFWWLMRVNLNHAGKIGSLVTTLIEGIEREEVGRSYGGGREEIARKGGGRKG